MKNFRLIFQRRVGMPRVIWAGQPTPREDVTRLVWRDRAWWQVAKRGFATNPVGWLALAVAVVALFKS